MLYPYQVDVSQVFPSATNYFVGHTTTIGVSRNDKVVVIKIEAIRVHN